MSMAVSAAQLSHAIEHERSRSERFVTWNLQDDHAGVKKFTRDLIHDERWVRLYCGLTASPQYRFMDAADDDDKTVEPHAVRFGNMTVVTPFCAVV